MKKIFIIFLLFLSIGIFAQEEKVETKESLYLEGLKLYSTTYDKESQKIAIDKFKKSADMKYAPAIMKVGVCYLLGKGVNKYHTKAIEIIEEIFPILEEAAKTDPYASYEFGNSLMYGYGTKPQKFLGFKYLMDASKTFPMAMQAVGICMINGNGCDRNVPEAIKYFERAKEQGLETADYYLGHIYLNAFGAIRNETKGVKYMEEAEKAGVIDATNYLGTMYLNGNGLKKDNDKAFFYFKKAAEKEHPRAMYNLGMCYMQGVGCDINEEEGLKYILAAAAAGDEKACDMLADKRHEELLKIK